MLLGLEIVVVALWYASTGALGQAVRHGRRSVGAARKQARQTIGQRLAHARKHSKRRGIRITLGVLYGAWVFVRVTWRSAAGTARAMRAGWETGWEAGVEKARSRRDWKDALRENERRDRAEAAGICPDCDHTWAEGRVDGCDCRSVRCPCSARHEKREQASDDDEPVSLDKTTEAEPVDAAPAVESTTENEQVGAPPGPGAPQTGESGWDEEITIRRRRPVETAGAEEAEVVDLDKVVADPELTPVRSPLPVQPLPVQSYQPGNEVPTTRQIRWRVDTFSPGGLLAAPLPLANEDPWEYQKRLQRDGWDVTGGPDRDDPDLLVVAARLRQDPDRVGPGDLVEGESPDDYAARVRAAGYHLEPLEDGTGFRVVDYTPPSSGSGRTNTSAGGNGMPVQGDGTTIGRTRLALQGFTADAVRFTVTAEFVNNVASAVRGEASRLARGAEQLGSNLALAQVDAESVGEVRSIQEQAASVVVAVAELDAAAKELGSSADALSAGSKSARSRLDAGHRGLEEARAAAPNGGATRRFYQPS
jgi:hypothetical protein